MKSSIRMPGPVCSLPVGHIVYIIKPDERVRINSDSPSLPWAHTHTNFGAPCPMTGRHFQDSSMAWGRIGKLWHGDILLARQLARSLWSRHNWPNTGGAHDAPNWTGRTKMQCPRYLNQICQCPRFIGASKLSIQFGLALENFTMSRDCDLRFQPGPIGGQK